MLSGTASSHEGERIVSNDERCWGTCMSCGKVQDDNVICEECRPNHWWMKDWPFEAHYPGVYFR